MPATSVAGMARSYGLASMDKVARLMAGPRR